MSYTYDLYINELRQAFQIEVFYAKEQDRYRVNVFHIKLGSRRPGFRVLQMLIDQNAARVTFRSDKSPRLSFDSLITYILNRGDIGYAHASAI